MSTRCNIHFVRGDTVEANIYRHSDGYPEGEHGVLAGLQQFFTDCESQTPHDTRYYDPEYLSARFIVWQAHSYTSRYNKQLLDFIGVGVAHDDHGDIEYVYTVSCSSLDEKGRPVVTFEATR